MDSLQLHPEFAINGFRRAESLLYNATFNYCVVSLCMYEFATTILIMILVKIILVIYFLNG